MGGGRWAVVLGGAPFLATRSGGWGFCSGFLGWLGGLASLSFADVGRPLEPVAPRDAGGGGHPYPTLLHCHARSWVVQVLGSWIVSRVWAFSACISLAKMMLCSSSAS